MRFSCAGRLRTDRAGGGAYERVFLVLFVFGTDGS